jgi:hypothetical protein
MLRGVSGEPGNHQGHGGNGLDDGRKGLTRRTGINRGHDHRSSPNEKKLMTIFLFVLILACRIPVVGSRENTHQHAAVGHQTLKAIGRAQRAQSSTMPCGALLGAECPEHGAEFPEHEQWTKCSEQEVVCPEQGTKRSEQGVVCQGPSAQSMNKGTSVPNMGPCAQKRGPRARKKHKGPSAQTKNKGTSGASGQYKGPSVQKKGLTKVHVRNKGAGCPQGRAECLEQVGEDPDTSAQAGDPHVDRTGTCTSQAPFFSDAPGSTRTPNSGGGNGLMTNKRAMRWKKLKQAWAHRAAGLTMRMLDKGQRAAAHVYAITGHAKQQCSWFFVLIELAREAGQAQAAVFVAMRQAKRHAKQVCVHQMTQAHALKRGARTKTK